LTPEGFNELRKCALEAGFYYSGPLTIGPHTFYVFKVKDYSAFALVPMEVNTPDEAAVCMLASSVTWRVTATHWIKPLAGTVRQLRGWLDRGAPPAPAGYTVEINPQVESILQAEAADKL